jgi:putative membrane protein
LIAGVLNSYLHLLSAIAIGALLYAELSLLFSAVDMYAVRRLAVLHLALIAAGALALITGVLAVVWAESPGFYLRNPSFWIKLAMFFAIVLIAVPPTRHLLDWRRELAGEGNAPHPDDVAHVRRYVVAEAVLFLLIPLAAAVAARGIGIQGG